MKKLLVCIIMVIAVSNCYSQKITVKDKNDLSPYAKELTNLFNTVDFFKDITNKGEYTFVTDENTGKSYVVGTGKTINGNHATFRSSASYRSQKLKINVNRSETCLGDNCGKCKFAITGGCECENADSNNKGAAGCNHSITTD